MGRLVKHLTKPWGSAERKQMISLYGGKVKIQASLFEYLLQRGKNTRRYKRKRKQRVSDALILEEFYKNRTIPAELKNFVRDLVESGQICVTPKFMQRQIRHLTRCMNPDEVSRPLLRVLENLRIDLVNTLEARRKH